MIDMPDKNIVRKMTDEELRSLLQEAQEEFDRREREARVRDGLALREAKERDWLAVREVIANFIEKWGWTIMADDL